MIKNGPDSLNAINSAGEIHFSGLALQSVVSDPAPGESSQKSSTNNFGIVFL